MASTYLRWLGERGDLDDVALEELVDLFLIEKIVEGVVERAEVGVDLLLERAGKEAEALACFDGGADEDDAADLLGDERGDGHGDGEVGLAGSGRSEAEGHVGLLDGFDVLALVGGAGLHHALDAGRALLAGFDEGAEGHGGVGDDQAEHAVELAVLERDAGLAEVLVVAEDAGDPVDVLVGSGDVDSVGAEIDGHVQAIFEEAKIFVASPVQGLNASSDFEGFFIQAVI